MSTGSRRGKEGLRMLYLLPFFCSWLLAQVDSVLTEFFAENRENFDPSKRAEAALIFST